MRPPEELGFPTAYELLCELFLCGSGHHHYYSSKVGVVVNSRCCCLDQLPWEILCELPLCSGVLCTESMSFDVAVLGAQC